METRMPESHWKNGVSWQVEYLPTDTKAKSFTRSKNRVSDNFYVHFFFTVEKWLSSKNIDDKANITETTNAAVYSV